MRIQELHSWNVTPQEAAQIQKQLREMVREGPPLKQESISRVAGCDVAYSKTKNLVYASVVVFSFPQLELLEEKHATSEVTFSYVPGLLAFREGPALLEVLQKLESEPDLVLFDGQGVAHPRRIGIASHIGIILGKPSVGVAKTVLCGDFQEPGRIRASSSSLTNKSAEIGRVLRTKTGVRPVFVSVGHQIDLESAERIVLNCCTKYRLPEPVRVAHTSCTKLRTSAR